MSSDIYENGPSSMAAPLAQSISSFMIPVSEGSDPAPVRSSLVRAPAHLERVPVRDAFLPLPRAAKSAKHKPNHGQSR